MLWGSSHNIASWYRTFTSIQAVEFFSTCRAATPLQQEALHKLIQACDVIIMPSTSAARLFDLVNVNLLPYSSHCAYTVMRPALMSCRASWRRISGFPLPQSIGREPLINDMSGSMCSLSSARAKNVPAAVAAAAAGAVS